MKYHTAMIARKTNILYRDTLAWAVIQDLVREPHLMDELEELSDIEFRDRWAQLIEEKKAQLNPDDGHVWTAQEVLDSIIYPQEEQI